MYSHQRAESGLYVRVDFSLFPPMEFSGTSHEYQISPSHAVDNKLGDACAPVVLDLLESTQSLVTFQVDGNGITEAHRTAFARVVGSHSSLKSIRLVG